jgi:hypothetical protein
MDKRAIIEERKKQFAPMIEAERLKLQERAKELYERTKAEEEQRQKSIEKSQARAAAVRAAKEQAEKDRMEAIIKNQQLSILKARQEARQKQIQQLLREQEAMERLEAERVVALKLQAEKERVDKLAKISNHPMKRFLSPLARSLWESEDSPDKKLEILASWENLRDFEVKVRSCVLQPVILSKSEVGQDI